MKVFKIRCSAIGKIMAGNIGLTANQKIDLFVLSKKGKITPKQEVKLQELKHKKDNPDLPETLKTLCKDWLKEQLLNRRKTFSNKYFDKGNIMEDESIDFIAKMLKLGILIKNEDYFENDFITGTPDIIINDLVIDAKNSWSYDTFPLFEGKATTKDYSWQLQGYMDLTGRKKGKLAYVLSNTPEHLIERDARFYCLNNGYEELDSDIYQEFHDRLTYDDIPDKYKIKIFEYEKDEAAINEIYERVKLCRIYIEQLKQSINGKSN